MSLGFLTWENPATIQQRRADSNNKRQVCPCFTSSDSNKCLALLWLLCNYLIPNGLSQTYDLLNSLLGMNDKVNEHIEVRQI